MERLTLSHAQDTNVYQAMLKALQNCVRTVVDCICALHAYSIDKRTSGGQPVDCCSS